MTRRIRGVCFVLAVVALCAANGYWQAPVLWCIGSGFLLGFCGMVWIDAAA